MNGKGKKANQSSIGGPSCERLSNAISDEIGWGGFLATTPAHSPYSVSLTSSSTEITTMNMDRFIDQLIAKDPDASALIAIDRGLTGLRLHLHGLVVTSLTPVKLNKIWRRLWSKPGSGKPWAARAAQGVNPLPYLGTYSFTASQRGVVRHTIAPRNRPVPNLIQRVRAVGALVPVWERVAHRLHVRDSSPPKRKTLTPSRIPQKILQGIRRRALCGWCCKNLVDPTRPHFRWHPACRRAAGRALARAIRLAGPDVREWVRRLEARGWPRRDAIAGAIELARRGKAPSKFAGATVLEVNSRY